MFAANVVFDDAQFETKSNRVKGLAYVAMRWKFRTSDVRGSEQTDLEILWNVRLTRSRF